VVTNDEMRDHIFSLLAPKYFYKWKERHLMRYMFKWPEHSSEPQLVCTYPPPYTTCLQRVSSGAWLLPIAGETQWLRIRPVPKQAAVSGNCR
jgi:proteinaceous RNase P